MEALGARAHDSSDIELQAEKSLSFMQQLLHTPSLLERPNSNGRFKQKPSVEILADIGLERRGQDISDSLAAAFGDFFK